MGFDAAGWDSGTTNKKDKKEEKAFRKSVRAGCSAGIGPVRL